MANPPIGSKTEICAYAFSRARLGGEAFIPCCPEYFKPEYFKLEPGPEPWNGPAAQELRQSMFDGDFKYCNRALCQVRLNKMTELQSNPGSQPEAPITRRNLDAILRGETTMPDGPSSVTVTVDPRCNLACPTCRSERVIRLTAQQKSEVDLVKAAIASMAKTLRVVRLAGDGEVFFSPFLRGLLKDFSPDKFPSLEYVFLLTNGLLLTEKNFAALRPGTDMVRRISVSIDAGTAEVYQKVRGGDWNVLMKNLSWVSALRSAGRLDQFSINFVLRNANFHTLQQFIELGKDLGADFAQVSPLMKWKGISLKDYLREAIQISHHPQHHEYLQLREQYKNEKGVLFR